MSYAILDVISKELADELELDKPIGDNEVLEFKLDRAGRVDPYSTKKTATPQGHIFAGKDYIKDPYDKKRRIKLIMNIIGFKPIAGEPGRPMADDPIEDYVRFGPEGRIYITSGQENQMQFIRLMNKNGSNPNRMTKTQDGRGIPKVFHEVD